MKIALTPFLLVVALATGSASAQQVVNVYSSMAEKDLRQLVAEFERRHGVKVNLWRSGKNRILQRVISEARAGRYEVDVIHNPSPEMEALHSEKLLKAVDSPLHANLIRQAVARHREWAGPRVYIFVQAYNTRVVSKAELPKTYADLLHGSSLETYSEVGYGYAVEKAPTTQGWTFTMYEELWNYGFPQEMRHFARCVRGKETPIADGETGRVVQEVLYAAYASAGQGKKIALPFRPKGVKKPIDLWKNP